MKISGLRHVVLMLAVILLVFAPVLALAQAEIRPCLPGSGKLCNPISVNDFNGFIKILLEGVLKIGMPLIALAIIYCGFLFVFARGNSEKLTEARKALLNTLIGAGILLGAWAISTLIANTVGQLG